MPSKMPSNPAQYIILTVDNEADFLAMPSEPVTPEMLTNGSVQAIVRQMQAAVDGVGIGLAAVQIGYYYRIVLADVGQGMEVFINPEIVGRSDEQVDIQEGCLSVPDKQYMVTRRKLVSISHTKMDGTTELVHLSPFGSIVLQHEIDHLDGITINQHGVPILTPQS